MTQAQVLAEFDKADIGGYTFFFHPDHGYVYIANSRISLYGDTDRWAVIFEKNGYGNRALETSIELNYFGNCLSNLDREGLNGAYISNTKYFNLFGVDDICLDEPEEDFELLDPKKSTVTIRTHEVDVIYDNKAYAQQGITLERSKPSIIEFTYLLAETRPEVLWANEEELRTCIPDGLPLIGRINEWHQDPDTLYEKPPSSNEAYQLIAKCIENRSLDPFKPSLPPNNHWSNWPEAGAL